MLEIMKSIPNWVCWKTIHRTDRNGKKKNIKLPISPHTGKAASSADRETWSTFEEAKQAYKTFRCDGVGFMFGGSGLTGVDLDHCFKNGELNGTAANIVEKLNSYTEVSPSEDGLHIIVAGEVPESIKRDDIEIYSWGRYFTVTGHHLPGTPTDVQPRQDELMTVYRRYAQPTIQSHDEEVTPELVRSALAAIPVQTDYNTEWIRVLMAVHSEFPGQNGISLIEEWCGHVSYGGEIDRKWRSFDRTPNNGVQIGTLFYIAGGYGWERPVQSLDDVNPPLTPSQRRQIEGLVDTLAQRRLWELYHKNITEAHLNALNLPKFVVDHFQIGFRERGSDGEAAYTVPHVGLDGEVFNVEYREVNGGGYSYEVIAPFMTYVPPMFDDHHNPARGLIVPDTLSGVATYLQHGGMAIHNDQVGIFAAPHVHLTGDSLTPLTDIDNIVVLTDRKNLDRFAALKDRARFVILPLPIDEAVELLSTKDMTNYFLRAQPYGSVI